LTFSTETGRGVVTVQTGYERAQGTGFIRKAAAALFDPALFDILPPRQLPRSGSFTARQIAIVCLAFLMVASIPLLTQPLPPLEDYVNHLARMQVIASIGSDPALARFYDIQWQIVPNLMMDLVVPPLAHVVGVYAAGQVFMVATFALILSGTLALNRALFGRWSLVPLIAAPLLYNYVFLVGVMNYMFGIGLALWATATWVRLRERALPLRLAVSTAFAIALFFCHLYALGVYGLALLAFELRRLVTLRECSLGSRLIDFAATGLPALAVLPLLLASPTWQLSAENYWEPLGKLTGLMYIVEVYSDAIAFALITTLAFAAIWAVSHRLVRLHPLGIMLLVIGGLIYLALPRVMFATYMADQRLPIALAFLAIACLHIDLNYRMARRGFLVLVLMLLVVRVIEVDANWAALSPTNLEFRDSVKRIKRGSTILVAYADRSAGDDVRDLGLVHAPCMAMIERSALVTTAFTVEGKQVMQVRPAYRNQVDTQDGTPPTIEQIVLAADQHVDDTTTYWHGWEKRFDYVYVLFTEDDAPNPAPERLKLVHDGGRFQLYKVIRSS
jgi:hypothetical protein